MRYNTRVEIEDPLDKMMLYLTLYNVLKTREVLKISVTQKSARSVKPTNNNPFAAMSSRPTNLPTWPDQTVKLILAGTRIGGTL